MPSVPYFKLATNGHHYYRRPVPAGLWDALGKREIKKALGKNYAGAVFPHAQVDKQAEKAIRSKKAAPPPTSALRCCVAWCSLASNLLTSP